MYGTSEKLLDINRGITKVRGVMIPETLEFKAKEEIIKYKKRDCFLILHDSYLARVWNYILFTMLLYTATVMPYKLALIEDQDNYELFIIDTAVDFLYIIDIVINFNSPIKRKED